MAPQILAALAIITAPETGPFARGAEWRVAIITHKCGHKTTDVAGHLVAEVLKPDYAGGVSPIDAGAVLAGDTMDITSKAVCEFCRLQGVV